MRCPEIFRCRGRAVPATLLAALLLLLPAAARAALDVVAATPDLAALAVEIGGDRVAVKALAKPTEDPHFVDPKPSHILALNRADVLIEGGAELEIGWLPSLIESSRNRKIATGAPGRILASQGVAMREVPTSFDRSQGDVHALGNPHFLLDPLNAKIAAAHIAESFALLDPGSAEIFRARREGFDAALDAKLAEWKSMLSPFRGAKIVTYHRDFSYLAARFELDVLETLESRPGIPPSPAHLAHVIEAMNAGGAGVILVQPYQNRRTAETVARATGAVVLDFPQQPGVVADTATYIQLMDHLVGKLAQALQAKE